MRTLADKPFQLNLTTREDVIMSNYMYLWPAILGMNDITIDAEREDVNEKLGQADAADTQYVGGPEDVQTILVS